MRDSRRRFIGDMLLATSGLAATTMLGRFAPRAEAHASSGIALRTPPLFGGGDLIAEVVPQNIWSDRSTQMWTIGGSSPAPTIRVRRGERFTARLVNHLDEPTNIHWHGLLVPEDMDGHPGQLVAPGASKEFSFVVNQRASMYWYHPHVHMRTASQVYLGMAGLFIVDDPDDDVLGLPDGAFDIPLVIQDKLFDANRQLRYAPSPMQQMSGLLGDTALVNGTPNATLDVSRDVYRFRLLNASNGRVMKFGLSDGSSFELIGSDGGLLDRPRTVTSLLMGPAERADILIDFTNRMIGTLLTLRSLPFDNAPDSSWQGWGLDLVQFSVTSAQRSSFTLPGELSELQRLDPASAVRTRSFGLAMVHQMPIMKHTINNREFEMDRIDERVAAGSTEIWEFVNNADEPHPMHIHAAQFQVYERNGVPAVAATDAGWKDTVTIPLLESARVAVRFAEHTGTFVAHCHNLEHEDTGMMLNFAIESTSHVDERENVGSVDLEPLTPQPAFDIARIAFTLDVAQKLTIRCFDSRGRLAAAIADREFGSGRHSIAFEVGELKSGRYTITLEANGHARSRPLVVVK